MIYLYRLIAYLIYVSAYPYGRIKAWQGDALWQGRLAETGIAPADIWLHAASVGEVRVISYLIHYLHQANPKLRLHLTVMTRTGFETARTVCDKRVAISFLPFDVPLLWGKMLRKLNPGMVVVAETEIWPNLITRLKAAGIPLVLVNGRLSERSFERYKALRASFSPLLASYDHFFVKGEDDLQRFIDLGVAQDKMTLAGDMKFDAPLADRSESRRRDMRNVAGVGDHDFLLVAGSTRAREEEHLFRLYQCLKTRIPSLRLILAPRHIERVAEIGMLAEQAGVPTHLLNEPARTPESVAIVNCMGILNDLYVAADLAFVGGTLVDIGGHNLLEPVWAGTPVLFGPSITNVRDAAEYIVAHRFGAMVQSADDLIELTGDVIEGRRTFATKTQTDLAHSATAAAGNYILSRLHHA